MMVKHLPKQHADNAAVLVGAVVELLVILDVPAKLGLSATDVARIGGLALIIAGALRGLIRSWRAAKLDPSIPRPPP